jgi:DNA polymerase-3 subunit alpha
MRSFASQELLDNIHAIVNEADIRLDPLDSFSYAIPSSGYLDRLSEIRSRCKARLKSLAHRHGQAAYDRFEHEMSALGEFSDYLLLMADFLAMCRAQGILTWTRGSAANSLVCYCLRIHDIDPIRYKLLFERFVNPARKKLPDVDIDVQSDRVDDVRRLIREHMEGLEGKGNTLPICTYGTLANRSAFRTMAEAQGFSKDRIDELAALLPQMIDSGMVKDESEAYALLKEEDPALYELASAVFDAPSGVGQHACGIAFGTHERPLDLWVPNYRIGSSDAVVTQYNMAAIEALGLTKQDWLKLDTLRIMAGTLRLAGRDDRYLRDIPLDDSATFALLRSGKTEGIHTFQGSVQREGCIEVKPESIDDLVAVQALYRPSGTRTGFTKTFCNRRFGREKWEPSRNPIVAEVLSETYGLPIYQEQIMEIGAKMGMTGAEIDDLYKAIKTAKGIGRGAAELFEQFKPVFMRYALKYADNEAAEDDWRLFDAFQGYGFNRGHATAYALLGYRSAYLKTHHQREFYISILEAYPDNPTYITAALRDGYKFEPPDINGSSGGFSPGRTQKAIRVGLLRVRDVGVGAVAEIMRGQPFRSLEDLRERTQAKSVDRTVVANLAAVGALESIGIKGEEDDATHFRLLNFCLNKPKVFEGVEPDLGRRYNGGSWRFRGLLRGVERYTDKSFCAKLFWIPPGAEIHRKAAAMGGYYAWLLTVVDENGLPFDLIASDKKVQENETLQLLAAKNEDPGIVICVEGQCKQPFLPKRATGFQFWAISGAEDKNPQMWNADMEVANMVMYLAEQKRFARSAA